MSMLLTLVDCCSSEDSNGKKIVLWPDEQERGNLLNDLNFVVSTLPPGSLAKVHAIISHR